MKKSKTNYVIVLDYCEEVNKLNQYNLLGWDGEYDWFDTDTYGYEILTPKKNIKRNDDGLLEMNSRVTLYVGETINSCLDYCELGNNEGYDCTICRLEKNENNDWIVIPQEIEAFN